MSTNREKVTLNISGVNAESNGRLVAGYVDNSTAYNFPGGSQFQSLPGRRPETAPSPSSTVPFRRDPEFVNRGTLDQIHEKCSAPASRIALSGIGGIGKSHLAIEYSYQVQDRSPGTWIFWVHASNAARFEQGWRKIADRAKIADREDPKVNIFKLVSDWLQNERNGKWILILDNVDNHLLHETPPSTGQNDREAQPLLSYLPPSPNGSIIMTTKSKAVAFGLADERDIIDVEPMKKTDALALLETKLKLEGNNSQELVELAEALEFMPLAITQAAAYIKRMVPRMSVARYLKEFRRSDRKKMSLLTHEDGQPHSAQFRRDREASNSIVITWQISFDHVRQIRPSAADLLSLMSFFDRQGIHESLLSVDNTEADEDAASRSSTNDDDGTTESSTDEAFEEDIRTLRDYSFISGNEDARTFQMHRLVQLAMQSWLESHGQHELWKQRYIRNLFCEFRYKHENWEKCQMLFPHVQSAMEQRPKSDESLEEWGWLLHRAAWYSAERGNLLNMEKMPTNAMQAMDKLFGPESEWTLLCMRIVGLSYYGTSRFQKAEELQAKALETSKKTLGAEHGLTAAYMSDLALTVFNQGRWQEAEELLAQAVETRKRVGRADDYTMLTIMGSLAMVVSSQGRLQEASEMQATLTETLKRVYGTGHAATLKSIHDLAATTLRQGRLQEAEKLRVQVVETSKRVRGLEDPLTLASMDILADVWKDLGRDIEALALLAECVELQTRALGSDHKDTLTSSAKVAAWKAEMLDTSDTSSGRLIEIDNDLDDIIDMT